MGEHIKNIIDKFIREAKGREVHQRNIERELAEFFEEESIEYVKRKEIGRDQVMLYFKSSSFIYDFNLKKGELLKKLQKKFPEIKEIKTRVT